jgi:non-homologous end joining protein Ku
MTLKYAHEVRAADAYFDEIPDVKIPAEILDLAEHILHTKAADFEAAKFEDTYQNAVVNDPQQASRYVADLFGTPLGKRQNGL